MKIEKRTPKKKEKNKKIKFCAWPFHRLFFSRFLPLSFILLSSFSFHYFSSIFHWIFTEKNFQKFNKYVDGIHFITTRYFIDDWHFFIDFFSFRRLGKQRRNENVLISSLIFFFVLYCSNFFFLTKKQYSYSFEKCLEYSFLFYWKAASVTFFHLCCSHFRSNWLLKIITDKRPNIVGN